MLCIRFHYGGWFQRVVSTLSYFGGDIGESWIDLDKVSFFEIKGHLEDHYKTDNVIRIHWLRPHMDMTSGLVLLVNDESCQVMLKAHEATPRYPEGLVVDMYTEVVENEVVPNAEEEIENEEAEVVAGEGQVDYELGVDGLLADDEQMNNEFCTDDEDQEFWTDDDNKNSVHLMDDKDYRSFCAFYKSPSKPTVQGADDVGEERGNYVVSEEEEDNQEDD